MMASISRKITRLGVIGAGQMGTGIGLVSIFPAKLNVHIYDTSAQQREKSEKYIKTFLTRKSLDPSLLNLIKYESTLDFVSECDFIIEAIPEILDLKLRMTEQLSSIMKPDAILATNTSSFPITKIGAASKNPQNFLGMHFMKPVELIHLTEVIKGLQTSDEAFDKAMKLSKLMGKESVACKDTSAFILNRVLLFYINTGVYLLYEGVASKEDIDNTMKQTKLFPLGPLRLIDYIGIDTALAASITMLEDLGDPKYRPCPLLYNYVDAGWHGVKTGQGFYKYSTK
jgi:3-hydroxybutyryl-CoA dehydrogenase